MFRAPTATNPGLRRRLQSIAPWRSSGSSDGAGDAAARSKPSAEATCLPADHEEPLIVAGHHRSTDRQTKDCPGSESDRAAPWSRCDHRPEKNSQCSSPPSPRASSPRGAERRATRRSLRPRRRSPRATRHRVSWAAALQRGCDPGAGWRRRVRPPLPAPRWRPAPRKVATDRPSCHRRSTGEGVSEHARVDGLPRVPGSGPVERSAGGWQPLQRARRAATSRAEGRGSGQPLIDSAWVAETTEVSRDSRSRANPVRSWDLTVFWLVPIAAATSATGRSA